MTCDNLARIDGLLHALVDRYFAWKKREKLIKRDVWDLGHDDSHTFNIIMSILQNK